MRKHKLVVCGFCGKIIDKKPSRKEQVIYDYCGECEELKEKSLGKCR